MLSDGYAGFTPSAGCTGNGVTHQPRSYNALSTKGGWGYGTASCITCYLSYQNDQQVPMDGDGGTGDYPPFIWTGEVYCSLAGVFWSLGGGAPPNNCDFKIVPDASVASSCNGVGHTTQAYQAKITPSLGACGLVPASSSCSWAVTGNSDISYVDNTENITSLSATCDAVYIAGNLKGSDPGTVQWTMTLQLSSATITHTQDATVSCPN